MKTKAIFIFAAACATFARADLVMIQETAAGEVKSRTTMSISGDMMRTDNGTETSVIMDIKTGNMTTLMHEQKMAMKVDMAQLKAAAAGATASADALKIEPGKLTATGKKQMINGYDCEEYTLENSGTTASMWITKDYPGYDKLKKELSALEKLNTSGVKQPETPGMAIRTETTVSGVKFATTLVSIKEQKVDPAIFKVPAGYQALGQ